MFWVYFAFYYAVGIYVSRFVVDHNNNPAPFWHKPFIALVWPAFFVLNYEDDSDD